MSDTPTPEAPTIHTPQDVQLMRTERILGSLLAWGVWGSLIVIIIGAILCFTRDHAYDATPGAVKALIAPQAANIDSLGKVFSGIVALNGQAIMMAGAVLLISTPALRVAVSLVVYMRQRDRAYTLLTATVLILLLWGYFKKQDKPLEIAPRPTPTATAPSTP
jgi:uncharacterized membrane protein